MNGYDSSVDYFETHIERETDYTDKMVKMYFHAAFADRFGRWVGRLTVITVLHILILYFYPSYFNLLAYGLSIDILGAVILATGLIRGIEGIKRDTRRREAVFGSFYSSSSLSSEARDTVDGIFGVSYLIIGFAIQIVSLYL